MRNQNSPRERLLETSDHGSPARLLVIRAARYESSRRYSLVRSRYVRDRGSNEGVWQTSRYGARRCSRPIHPIRRDATRKLATGCRVGAGRARIPAMHLVACYRRRHWRNVHIVIASDLIEPWLFRASSRSTILALT